MTLGLEPVVEMRVCAHPGPQGDTRPVMRIT